MDSTQRLAAIRTILSARERVRTVDLAERLSVSEVTIRKDLVVLEEQGFLSRTHGGAVLAERQEPHHNVSARMSRNSDTKRALARAARALIGHGETIYVDAGSTCAALASELVDMELRVVTDSLDVANRLAEHPGITLFMLGGSYRHGAGSFIGPWAQRTLEMVQLDRAFLGATGISRDGRFSAQNSIESDLKRAVVTAARTSVVLADREKLGVAAFSVFASVSDISALITDATPAESASLVAAGLEIIHVAPQATNL
jgi:DeoR family fructose operon transcriptional repressor